MSYDIDIEPAPHPECRAHAVPHQDCLAHPGQGLWMNMTSNVAPVWRAAGVDLIDLDGKTLHEAVPVVEPALARLEADPRSFDQYVRGDGTWGDVESAIRLLRFIVDEGKRVQHGILRVSS